MATGRGGRSVWPSPTTLWIQPRRMRTWTDQELWKGGPLIGFRIFYWTGPSTHTQSSCPWETQLTYSDSDRKFVFDNPFFIHGHQIFEMHDAITIWIQHVFKHDGTPRGHQTNYTSDFWQQSDETNITYSTCTKCLESIVATCQRMWFVYGSLICWRSSSYFAKCSISVMMN